MLNINVQPPSVEENFVFGSPPLLNGFVYNSCRSETLLNNHHESFNNYNNVRYQPSDVPLDQPPTMAAASPADLNRKPYIQQQKFPIIPYTPRNYVNFHKNRTPNESVAENLSQLNLGSHVDKGIKILEQVGFKVQQQQQQQQQAPPSPDLTFKKRKDLRVLKLALSNERFREVAVKFGDGDEGGREISESVHRTLRRAKTTTMSCVYCKTDCQVYENFPIVDGTLFLTPVARSPQCIRFFEKHTGSSGAKAERFLGFVCVGCMEGKKLSCASCHTQWNGSFFQVGTMYSYDILSATPCCESAVTCNKCRQPVVDMNKGEAQHLYFSNFSARTSCPHCGEEDFHFIKPLSFMTLDNQCHVP